MRTLLLSGFEPFGGEKTNPSLEAVKSLDGYIAGDVRVVALELPVAWDKVMPLLRENIALHRPSFVIAVGQAGGRAKIAVERVGLNVCFGKDNPEQVRAGEPVVLSEPDGYFASLPLQGIVSAMNAVSAPAYISNTAGTYLCNFTLYALEHIRRFKSLPLQTGFVHIPYLPAQVVNKESEHLPSMSLETVVIGLRAAIDYLATTNVPEVGTPVS